MKKISITVDLEDNELLTEEMEKALRGYARQIARSELSKEVDNEIQRIIDNMVTSSLKQSAYGYSYSGPLYKKVCDRVRDVLNKDYTDMIDAATSKAIKDITVSKIEKIIDSKIKEAVTSDTIVTAVVKTLATMIQSNQGE